MSEQVPITARTEELRENTALSDREAHVQALRETGLSRQAIADELGVKKSTVREYVSRIDDKRREAESTTSVLDSTDKSSSTSTNDATRTPQLYLAPCSNDHAQEHFEDTVLDGVSVTKYTDTLPAQFHARDRLPVWGTGAGNASAAEAMQPGDIIAFYVGDTTYSHIAVVRSVQTNESLARNIWRDKDGDTWPYVMFLEDPVEIDLDSVAFHNDIGYDIAYPLGFTRVAPEKVDQLRRQHGSLEEYFQQARARTAFEQGEELPIDMYLGPTEDEDKTKPSLTELRETAEQQSNETVTTTTSTQTQYTRSEAVKQYARTRADGVCEGCGDSAPFTSKTGNPYLEVHHVFEVSDDGPDKPDAVIAICPNCHRQVHYGEEGNAYNRELIETLDEIEDSLDLDGE